MKDIDFLPQRFRERRAQQQNRVWGLTVCGAFGSLIAAAFVGQTAMKMRAQQQLDVVEQQYQQAQTAQLALNQLRQKLILADADAELITYLQHPWPRTQLLARLTHSLPSSVVLRKLQVLRDDIKPIAVVPGVIKPTVEPAAAAPTGTAAQRDLKRLRDENDVPKTVIQLEGDTTEITALHAYLNVLANDRLFAQAELTSIESSPDGPMKLGLSQRSRFLARLTVRPGYGQRGGPEGPAVKSTSPASKITAVSSIHKGAE